MRATLHPTVKLLVEPGALRVVRPKWPTLGVAFLLPLASVAFAVAFYRLAAGRTGDVPAFVALFSSLFAAAGGLALLRLPSLARGADPARGFLVLLADRDGVSVAAHPGTRPRRIPWAGVDEIVVAQRLTTIDPDEVVRERGVVVVFLRHSAAAAVEELAGPLERLATSGAGRPYLTARFPPDDGIRLAAGLVALAPGALAVRHVHQARLDAKARRDQFD